MPHEKIPTMPCTVSIRAWLTYFIVVLRPRFANLLKRRYRRKTRAKRACVCIEFFSVARGLYACERRAQHAKFIFTLENRAPGTGAAVRYGALLAGGEDWLRRDDGRRLAFSSLKMEDAS